MRINLKVTLETISSRFRKIFWTNGFRTIDLPPISTCIPSPARKIATGINSGPKSCSSCPSSSSSSSWLRWAKDPALPMLSSWGPSKWGGFPFPELFEKEKREAVIDLRNARLPKPEINSTKFWETPYSHNKELYLFLQGQFPVPCVFLNEISHFLFI